MLHLQLSKLAIELHDFLQEKLESSFLKSLKVTVLIVEVLEQIGEPGKDVLALGEDGLLVLEGRGAQVLFELLERGALHLIQLIYRNHKALAEEAGEGYQTLLEALDLVVEVVYAVLTRNRILHGPVLSLK